MTDEPSKKGENLSEYLDKLNEKVDFKNPAEVADFLFQLVGNLLIKQNELYQKLVSGQSNDEDGNINQRIEQLNGLLVLYIQPLAFVPDHRAFVILCTLAMTFPYEGNDVNAHKAIVSSIAEWLDRHAAMHFGIVGLTSKSKQASAE